MARAVERERSATATVHTLKCWPAYFDAVGSGDKPFEVRRDDRGFQKGDVLVLQRTRAERLTEVDVHWRGHEMVAKHEMRFVVTYVLTGGQFGIEPGYVVMGLRRLPNEEPRP